MKKKLVSFVGATLLSAVVLAGCGSQSGSASEVATQTTSEAATGAELKTGLGTSVSIADSKDATAEGDGTAQADATIAAVTVDADGKITQCVIDIAQTKIGASADGKITSDLAAEYPSKRELGDNYGMKKASAIGKEWYEQADAFAAWAVGKTASDLSGMAISEGYAGDADLAASVSIHVTGFQAAVLEAVNNATAMGAHEGDKLGLGVTTNIEKSVDASAEGDGTAEAYTTISVLTVGNDGKITSNIIDAVQAKITFDAAGVITADKSAEVQSKNELGDAYGMKKASAIGKEWNEQAAAYAAYTVGKTADEVAGTAMEEGRAADADLAASVSVHITDFNAVIAKAVAAAK
ncbi:hypothetical protein D6855_04695 [Butyrivibrio sp. CB08]|uniref:hypothetical protein n=1 Tax=Butyrivibrio sp. CB08 TaxID=2364879 RepID=UPI000EA8D405|nr:hypothetical protein [Butyrivibrio sp. CB08]RKM61198.1 hypothetical protein D6855_04695 [Butyrivibrio sp. CB08]